VVSNHNHLACRNDDCKEAKEHDEYALGTYLEADNKLVGHVPMELSISGLLSPR